MRQKKTQKSSLDSPNTQRSREWFAKVFTYDKGNTFLNIGARYPNQTFAGSIPPASAVPKSPMLADIEGKHVKITGRMELYKGKPERSLRY
jgi:hypothetical protein